MVNHFGALAMLMATFCLSTSVDWGFYAHRKINRYAVYSLPDPLFSFYKRHQSYIEVHAVDADKRRYAVKQEAVFHYIDLDKYNEDSTDLFFLQTARWKYSAVEIQKGGASVFQKRIGDTTGYYAHQLDTIGELSEWLGSLAPENELLLEREMSGERWQLSIVDSFTHHGLLPYRLERMVYSLEKAFVDKDVPAILRLSADIGHYVGDAHVPLHTTENYNGQLTNQLGIHGFWESRLPELFHNKTKFIQIRPAEYVSNYKAYIWQIINESHSEVDRVFLCEKTARGAIDEDNLMCYDQRSGAYHWQPCPEYAAAFDSCMGSMVWSRWEWSINRLGSLWYTAWLNAGEPDLNIDAEAGGGNTEEVADRMIEPDRSCQ
jgi:hypothetical protein